MTARHACAVYNCTETTHLLFTRTCAVIFVNSARFFFERAEVITVLTESVVEIKEALALLVLEQIKVRLDVSDLDVGLVRIERAPLDGVRVFQHHQLAGAEPLRIKRLNAPAAY